MALELIVNLLLIAGGIFCFVNVSTTMPHSAVNELGAEQWPQAQAWGIVEAGQLKAAIEDVFIEYDEESSYEQILADISSRSIKKKISRQPSRISFLPSAALSRASFSSAWCWW